MYIYCEPNNTTKQPIILINQIHINKHTAGKQHVLLNNTIHVNNHVCIYCESSIIVI